MRLTPRLAVSLAVFTSVLVPRLTRAESGSREDAGFIPAVCGYTEPVHTTPPAGDVPVNWPWFVIHLTPRLGVMPSQTQLVRRSDGVEVPVTTGVTGDGEGIVVTPLEPLIVGETYDLVHPFCDAVPMETTTYVVTEPLPAPTRLGTLVVSSVFASYVGSTLEYYFLATLLPDPEFEPWRPLYVVSTTPSAPSRDTDQWIFGLRCGCVPGELASGPYLIEAMASPLDGAAPALTATARAMGSASCEDAVIVDPTTLRALTEEQIAFYANGGVHVDVDGMDAGVHGSEQCMDASRPMLDADGTHEVDGGRMGMHTEPDTHGNCGCRAGGRGGPSSALATMVGLCVALGAMRRRRSKRHTHARSA